MIKTDIVGDFGEAFIAALFYSLGYKVDIVNAMGIDLTAYKDKLKLGISVKSRNIQFNPNKSISLKYNDIVYTYDESKLRSIDMEPSYAFVVADLERIDILVVTQKYLFDNLVSPKCPIKDIVHYKNMYENKEVSGSTKSVSISKTAREKWLKLEGEEGVIFVGTYSLNK